MKPIDMKMLINKLENINEGENDYKTLGKGGYAAAHEQGGDAAPSFSVMTNNARDLGTQIAEYVILEDHTRAHNEGTERSDPDVIKAIVDAELKTMVSHMRANATKYIRQRYYE